MINDWPREIAIAWYVRSAMQEADINRLWKYHLPSLAAGEQQLLEVESVLGEPLNPSHRRFLQYANGWHAFYQSVDLFGTDDLRPEGMRMRHTLEMFDAIDGVVFQHAGVARQSLIPIAAAAEDLDIFAMVRHGYPDAGEILWFAGDLVDRFASFDDYFLAMVDYNRRDLQRLNAKQD